MLHSSPLKGWHGLFDWSLSRLPVWKEGESGTSITGMFALLVSDIFVSFERDGSKLDGMFVSCTSMTMVPWGDTNKNLQAKIQNDIIIIFIIHMFLQRGRLWCFFFWSHLVTFIIWKREGRILFKDSPFVFYGRQIVILWWTFLKLNTQYIHICSKVAVKFCINGIVKFYIS